MIMLLIIQYPQSTTLVIWKRNWRLRDT